VADIVGHELGHAVDVTLLDERDRQQWLAARGVPAGTAWFAVDDTVTLGDFGSGAGDFAESFAAWQTGKVSQSRLGGQPSETQLRLLATLAAG
jgi:hypothetical protein